MTNVHTWRRRAHTYLFGDYGGAPVDYLIAIAIVFAMIAVVGASIIQNAVPVIAEGLLSALIQWLDHADYGRAYNPS